MDPKNPNEPSEEQKKAFAEAMAQEHTMVFTKGELLVLFNVLTRKEFTYGDFFAIHPIIKKLEPIVTAQAPQNITKAAEKAEANHKEKSNNSLITGRKKN